MNQSDARIIIYPSIIMAVTVEDVNEFYKMTERKLNDYAKSKEEEQNSDEQ